jgi:hypothetical protein
MTSQIHVLIGLPTTSQSMKSATALAISNTCIHLTQLNRRVDLHNIDSAEIVTARDMLANMVLHSSDWTHLLFIDSDMQFQPSLVDRLFSIGASVSAVAYVRRNLDLARLLEVGRSAPDLGTALALASSFTFKPAWQEDQTLEIRVRDGFCSAAAVGMGCALISRQALEQMVAEGVVRPRNDLRAANHQQCWSFFETIEVDGVRLGEDYSFCYRWTKLLGQELQVCIDTPIGHLGDFEYSARYLDLLSPAGGT